MPATQSGTNCSCERGEFADIDNEKGEDRLVFPSPSDTNRTQTCNLLIRSQMLYSIKLWCQSFCFASAKIGHFLRTTKYFANFFIKNSKKFIYALFQLFD